MTIPLFASSPEDYHGFEKYTYDFEGHPATVCLPRPGTQKENAPFMWRTEFFGAFDWVDAEMLNRGSALVNYQISDLFGCDEAVALMGRFFSHVTESWGLPQKTLPIGFSRGGMYAVNFAAAFAPYVAALYLDAPVLDIKSWPAGLGEGEGSPHDTELAYRLFGLDEKTVRTFDKNPIDRVPKLIEARIPVVLVAGEADTLVPYRENGARLAKLYRAAGVRCTRFLKPECGHHPHSMENPAPICDALEEMMCDRQ